MSYSQVSTNNQFDQIKSKRLKDELNSINKKQNTYLIKLAITVIAIVLYYFYFFHTYGTNSARVIQGIKDFGSFLFYMFYWKDFSSWPIAYYLEQILITVAIVITATVSASLVAISLSFLAARNLSNSLMMKPIVFCFRRLFDVLRAVDIAVWGLIFVRAIGMGPFAGVLAIFVADVGFLGRLYADSHESANKSPTRGLEAVGANSFQKHRFGIFTQSFPQFLALALYEIESNIRSASVLGFVGAGGIGLVYAESMRLWQWGVVGFITLVLVVIVMLMDKVSLYLREKYIVGEAIPLYQNN